MTNAFEIEIDSDGYPTEESLEQIENYSGSAIYLMREVVDYFNNCGYGVVYVNKPPSPAEKTVFELSTGGWSGCEDVIDALKNNRLWWVCCWRSLHRGGHYSFEVSNTLMIDPTGEPND